MRESMPIDDNEMDAAFAHRVLHYVPSPSDVVREMARVVKPGGKLMIIDFVPHTHEWMKQELGIYWMGFESKEVREWFSLAGLTDIVPATAAIHALTVGAFGTMVLAVMTRASLGHTGRELTATPGTTVIFILITVAAILRVGASFLNDQSLSAIWISGIAWTAAYGLFAVLYFPVFTQPRVQAR